MTTHKLIIGDSASIPDIPDSSVQLIVTSPPYPMVEMWDEQFTAKDGTIGELLQSGFGKQAFDRMHAILNRTWFECDRVLADGGFICINIGDAVRTVGGEFCLYPNHAKIIEFFGSLGYFLLPDIHWRKPTNAPNKFMGSGMYPAGAYVTYEHEYILIFRKGGKRSFSEEERLLRQKSAYFWEERNVWFSDLWDVKGASQAGYGTARSRSAAFPHEIPYRLVNMYSIEGDTVLDPFAGLGTTMLACMASQRNSIGVEIEVALSEGILTRLEGAKEYLNDRIDARFIKHGQFLDGLNGDTLARCYENLQHGIKVKTQQETALRIDRVESIDRYENHVEVFYQ